MTTFKHGDRVTCEIAGIKITVAEIAKKLGHEVEIIK